MRQTYVWVNINHLLLLRIHIVHGIFPELFQPGEWEFVLGYSAHTIDSKNPLPKWVSPECNEIYQNFVTSLPKLANNINFNDKEWEAWNNDINCEDNFPSGYANKLSKF